MEILSNMINNVRASTGRFLSAWMPLIAPYYLVCLLAIAYSTDDKLLSRFEGTVEQCYITVLVFSGVGNLWRRQRSDSVRLCKNYAQGARYAPY